MTRPERRQTPRRSPGLEDPFARLRLRTGYDVVVLDISDGGALVEGSRLLPGAGMEVQATTLRGRVAVRSRVVRSHVWGVLADRVTYRSALMFEARLDTRDGREVPLPSRRGQSTPCGAGLSLPQTLKD